MTTEDPAHDFRPDTGAIEVFRAPGGMGIRLDEGPGFVGAQITPHYDSLLMKVTARAATRLDAATKLQRALRELRVRGVKTNKQFLLNVLRHPDFLHQTVNTSFIAQNPELLSPALTANRANKLLKYVAHVTVNGPPADLGAQPGVRVAPLDPVVPGRQHFRGSAASCAPVAAEPSAAAEPRSLKRVLDEDGPAAFAHAVRARRGVLVTDTTWRDAHQSLLATRVRTRDILAIAPATAAAIGPAAYSFECWGGATFDVAMRFLREDPWERLAAIREKAPDVPTQMLLRGANGVGYTSYPDNVVHRFCALAHDAGMDVFRVFDSLNYLENMRLGVDAAGASGGVVEAAIGYTGDVLNPRNGQYDLEYYLTIARELVAMGAHVLAIKDMAGLLRPEAATLLVGALRAEFPDVPIHVHTHDTAGTGVASMLAAAAAGADAVDAATDALSGTTSQPSLGALVAALRGTARDTTLDLDEVSRVNEYWEEARALYAPFESGQKSGSADVYLHEMPGGQYTNLLFQSQQLGLAGRWPAIKRAYASANRLLGDIVKVTPSSKVVGDLAQFMVANDLSEDDVRARAAELSFPTSVVEYFQGYLGVPEPYGFPEELRAAVLAGRPPLANGKDRFDGRPGAEMEPYDFCGERYGLGTRYPLEDVTDRDVMSHAQYPAVFKEFMDFKHEYGDLSVLDTRTFLEGLAPGQEIQVQIEHGKTLVVRLLSVSAPDAHANVDVTFELNGSARVVRVRDERAAAGPQARGAVSAAKKADEAVAGAVGAPMPGVVVEARVKAGDAVDAGDALVVLSAMKMETIVNAPCAGVVRAVEVAAGDSVEPGDLIVTIDEAGAEEAA